MTVAFSLGVKRPRFTLELKISDVEALKELHVSFKYDSNYVEYLNGKIDSIFNTRIRRMDRRRT